MKSHAYPLKVEKQHISGDVKPLPIWIRPPAEGQEHYTSLSRAKMRQLADAGLIESRTFKEHPDAIRSIRVYRLQTILDWMETGQKSGPRRKAVAS